MLHFAGAASHHAGQPLARTLRSTLRTAFAAHIGGTCDAHEDARLLVLLERRPAPRPAHFHHFTATTSASTVMFSGLLYDDAPSVRGHATDADVKARICAAPPEQLVTLAGDFALVSWNDGHTRLSLVSSFMGVMPLYYADVHGAIVWGSNLQTLRMLVDRQNIDRSFLIGFLSRGRTLDRSPYADIRSVRPGSILTFHAAAAPTSQEFITFVDRDLRHADEREYAHRVCALVQRAVEDRMPSAGACHTELSGGFDSSTVTLLASQIARRKGAAVRSVHYTSTSSPEWNERRFAAAVAQEARVDVEIVDFDDLVYFMSDDVSPDVASPAEHAAAKLIHARGEEVLLSGRVGDAIFAHTRDNSLAAFEHFRAGRYRTFGSKLLEWSLATNRPVIQLAGRMLLAQVFPRWSAAWLAPSRRPHNIGDQDTSLPPAAREEARRLKAELVGRGALVVRPAKRRLLTAVLGYSRSRALQNRLDGVMYLYPFVDKRLIDYLLAVPADLHAAPDRPRHLMRLAFDQLWPGEVRQRVGKGYAAPAVSRLLKPYAQALQAQRQFVLADLGLLTVDDLRCRLTRYLGGGATAVGNLEQIWCAEEWLRRIHGVPSLISGKRDGRAPASANSVRLSETLP